MDPYGWFQWYFRYIKYKLSNIKYKLLDGKAL